MVGARWEVDLSEWPLAYLALDRRTGEEVDFPTFFSACEEILARRQRHVLVLDLTGNRADAARRRLVATWFDARRPDIQRWVGAISVIAREPLHRGVITAMIWLRPAPMPVECFGTDAEARAWARRQLLWRRVARAGE
jgi:hypothetical protein